MSVDGAAPAGRPIATVDDRDPRMPWLSIVFGFGPMLPIVAAAAACWVLPMPWPLAATALAIWWAGAILIFLAGVRRGYAFTMAGGERVAQMATMIWLFLLGIGAFVAPGPLASLGLLLIGYASVGVLDPVAARRGEVPAHFARLRPPQMALAAIALAALILWHLSVAQRIV